MKKRLASITLVLLLSFFAAKATDTDTHFPVPAHITRVNFDEGIKVKLILAGKTYDLLTYNLNYTALDKSQPNLMPSATLPFANNVNNINVSIRSTKVDQELMDWMLSAESAGKDGQIIVTDGESGKPVKTITFTTLKPAGYSETFYNNSNVTILQPTTVFNMHFSKVSIKQ